VSRLLHSFIELNNLALARFSAADRARLGVHTCPGGDRDSTHSAEVDYALLLPSLFELNVGNFYVALAGEQDRRRTLQMIRQYLKPGQRIFVGVVAPIDPRIETAAEVRDRILEAAEYIPVEQLGTTDDCGFSPFCDDTSTTRETAFAKIRAGVGRHEARGPRARRMSTVDEHGEEEQLRSVALQTAQSIPLRHASARTKSSRKRGRRCAKASSAFAPIFEQAAGRHRDFRSRRPPRRDQHEIRRDSRLPGGRDSPRLLRMTSRTRTTSPAPATHVARLLAGEIRDYSYEKRYVRKGRPHGMDAHVGGPVEGSRGTAAPVHRRDRGHYGAEAGAGRQRAPAEERTDLLERERAARNEAERMSALKDEFLANAVA
jgi:hypothetical protein